MSRRAVLGDRAGRMVSQWVLCLFVAEEDARLCAKAFQVDGANATVETA
jgi:hypothetical protein